MHQLSDGRFIKTNWMHAAAHLVFIIPWHTKRCQSSGGASFIDVHPGTQTGQPVRQQKRPVWPRTGAATDRKNASESEKGPWRCVFVLAILESSAIMRVKNKKCGSFWGVGAPKACTGGQITYTTAPGRTAWTILYSFSPGNARGFPCIPPRETLYFVVPILGVLGVGVGEGIFAS